MNDHRQIIEGGLKKTKHALLLCFAVTVTACYCTVCRCVIVWTHQFEEGQETSSDVIKVEFCVPPLNLSDVLVDQL